MDEWYTVQPGDSLWEIAQRFYGDGNRYMEIFYANDSILDPDQIYVGQQVYIPNAVYSGGGGGNYAPASYEGCGGGGGSYLQIGSQGDDVVIIQQALGLYPDGIFGPQTQQAIINFQAQAGITPDGIIGPVTRQTLLNWGYSV